MTDGLTVKVNAVRNGPNVVSGLEAYLLEGSAESGASVALCRCGASENKPFCDGSHRRVGFEAPAVAIELRPA